MIKVGDKFITGFGHIVRMIRTEDDIGYFERIDDNEIIGKCHIQYVEKEWIKYIDFEDYEQQKQRADELEDMLNKEVEESYQMENRWRTEIERADELEKQNDILKHNIIVELDSNRDMYIGMCEQKLRADQLEKRWEKLKEHFINEKEQSFGILSWSRNNGMLELMEDLEEDGE